MDVFLPPETMAEAQAGPCPHLARAAPGSARQFRTQCCGRACRGLRLLISLLFLKLIVWGTRIITVRSRGNVTAFSFPRAGFCLGRGQVSIAPSGFLVACKQEQSWAWREPGCFPAGDKVQERPSLLFPRQLAAGGCSPHPPQVLKVNFSAQESKNQD